jgi:hypothetical protein
MEQIKRNYRYTCYFRIEGTDFRHPRSLNFCPAPDSKQGMLSFMHGFWVDIKGNLVEDILQREEDLIWIPPHKVDHIERKLIIEEGQE